MLTLVSGGAGDPVTAGWQALLEAGGVAVRKLDAPPELASRAALDGDLLVVLGGWKDSGLAALADWIHGRRERGGAPSIAVALSGAELSEQRRTGADLVLDRPDPEDVVAAISALARAVVPRAGAEEAKAVEDRYRGLLDALPGSVLLLSEEMRVVLANRNFFDKAKRTAADTIGKALAEVFPEVIVRAVDLTRNLEQVLHSRQPLSARRLTYRAPGVPWRTYSYSLIPVDWSGGGRHVLFVMEDVSEQIRLGEEIRRVERHLASVVESASDVVLSTGADGRILTWNGAAARLSSYSADEIRGRHFWKLLPEAVAAEAASAFRKLARGKSGSLTAEWDLVSRSGERMPVSWVFSTMQDEGAAAGIVAVGRDLTERRKWEAQLLESQKLAALGVMAGGIAHEIRTPLAVSSSAAQFLLEEDIGEAFRKECAAKVHAGIQRASVIIENLLRFARPSLRAEMAPVDLNAVLDEATKLVAHQARLQQVEIRTAAPAPAVVRGLAHLLEQVFLNLLLNALNAMPGGGSVSVAIASDAGEAVVRVADSGCGIPESDLDRIFEPFYTKAPAGQGTGLGLSICYSIVREHGGSIRARSTPGKGSEFEVRLPLES